MRLTFRLLNPFYKTNNDFESKDYFYRHWTLSKNKSAEIQISRFDRFHLIDCTVDLHWWGDDHAGPALDLNFLGYMFNVKVYDHRHWDYDNHCWEKYELTENEKPVD